MSTRKKTSRKKTTKKPDDAALTYEQAIEQAEAIADRIESGEIGLERSVEEYERGMALLKRCRQILDEAEARVTELSLDDDDERGGDARAGG